MDASESGQAARDRETLVRARALALMQAAATDGAPAYHVAAVSAFNVLLRYCELRNFDKARTDEAIFALLLDILTNHVLRCADSADAAISLTEDLGVRLVETMRANASLVYDGRGVLQ